MKIELLNGWAGIGGNTHKLDRNKYNITHVEINQEIAQANQKLHPKDTVIQSDAKQFLVENYQDFDYIWASPPCPSHSSIAKAGAKNGQYSAKMPDMSLYSVIIFLDEYFEGDWTVENVKPFYERLDEQERQKADSMQRVIPPAEDSNRHLFWSSHEVPQTSVPRSGFNKKNNEELMDWLGIRVHRSFETVEKRKVLRNCVHPEIGKAIVESRNVRQSSLAEAVQCE